MPDGWRAQGCEIDALFVVLKINRLDDALTLRVAGEVQTELLPALRPGHDQLVALTLQQSYENIFGRKKKRITGLVFGRMKDQIVADETGKDAVVDGRKEADAF